MHGGKTNSEQTWRNPQECVRKQGGTRQSLALYENLVNLSKNYTDSEGKRSGGINLKNSTAKMNTYREQNA